jgi:hypothetical protein
LHRGALEKKINLKGFESDVYRADALIFLMAFLCVYQQREFKNTKKPTKKNSMAKTEGGGGGESLSFFPVDGF